MPLKYQRFVPAAKIPDINVIVGATRSDILPTIPLWLHVVLEGDFGDGFLTGNTFEYVRFRHPLHSLNYNYSHMHHSDTRRFTFS